MALKDATREALTLDQMQLNDMPSVLNSQSERQTQIELQRNLGSRPTALTLDGITPGPSATDHALFTQTCMAYGANRIAGNPADSVFPPAVIARCHDATFVAFEAFFAQQTSKYNVAFLRTLMGDEAFSVVLAPGQVTDPGLHIVHWRPPQ